MHRIPSFSSLAAASPPHFVPLSSLSSSLCSSPSSSVVVFPLPCAVSSSTSFLSRILDPIRNIPIPIGFSPCPFPFSPFSSSSTSSPNYPQKSQNSHLSMDSKEKPNHNPRERHPPTPSFTPLFNSFLSKTFFNSSNNKIFIHCERVILNRIEQFKQIFLRFHADQRDVWERILDQNLSEPELLFSLESFQRERNVEFQLILKIFHSKLMDEMRETLEETADRMQKNTKMTSDEFLPISHHQIIRDFLSLHQCIQHYEYKQTKTGKGQGQGPTSSSSIKGKDGIGDEVEGDDMDNNKDKDTGKHRRNHTDRGRLSTPGRDRISHFDLTSVLSSFYSSSFSFDSSRIDGATPKNKYQSNRNNVTFLSNPSCSPILHSSLHLIGLYLDILLQISECPQFPHHYIALQDNDVQYIMEFFYSQQKYLSIYQLGMLTMRYSQIIANGYSYKWDFGQRDGDTMKSKIPQRSAFTYLSKSVPTHRIESFTNYPKSFYWYPHGFHLPFDSIMAEDKYSYRKLMITHFNRTENMGNSMVQWQRKGNEGETMNNPMDLVEYLSMKSITHRQYFLMEHEEIHRLIIHFPFPSLQSQQNELSALSSSSSLLAVPVFHPELQSQSTLFPLLSRIPLSPIFIFHVFFSVCIDVPKHIPRVTQTVYIMDTLQIYSHFLHLIMKQQFTFPLDGASPSPSPSPSPPPSPIISSYSHLKVLHERMYHILCLTILRRIRMEHLAKRVEDVGAVVDGYKLWKEVQSKKSEEDKKASAASTPFFVSVYQDMLSLLSILEFHISLHSPMQWLITTGGTRDSPLLDAYNGVSPLRVNVMTYPFLLQFLSDFCLTDRALHYAFHYIRYSANGLIIRSKKSQKLLIDRRVMGLAIKNLMKPTIDILDIGKQWEEERESQEKMQKQQEGNGNGNSNTISVDANHSAPTFLTPISPLLLLDTNNPRHLRTRLSSILFHYVSTLPSAESTITGDSDADDGSPLIPLPTDFPEFYPFIDQWIDYKDFSSRVEEVGSVLKNKVVLMLQFLDSLFHLLMSVKEFDSAIMIFKFLSTQQWRCEVNLPMEQDAKYPKTVDDNHFGKVELAFLPTPPISPSQLPMTKHVQIILNHTQLSCVLALKKVPFPLIYPYIPFYFPSLPIANSMISLFSSLPPSSPSVSSPLLSFLPFYHSLLATATMEYENQNLGILSLNNVSLRKYLFDQLYSMLTGRVMEAMRGSADMDISSPESNSLMERKKDSDRRNWKSIRNQFGDMEGNDNGRGMDSNHNDMLLDTTALPSSSSSSSSSSSLSLSPPSVIVPPTENNISSSSSSPPMSSSSLLPPPPLSPPPSLSLYIYKTFAFSNSSSLLQNSHLSSSSSSSLSSSPMSIETFYHHLLLFSRLVSHHIFSTELSPPSMLFSIDVLRSSIRVRDQYLREEQRRGPSNVKETWRAQMSKMYQSQQEQTRGKVAKCISESSLIIEKEQENPHHPIFRDRVRVNQLNHSSQISYFTPPSYLNYEKKFGSFHLVCSPSPTPIEHNVWTLLWYRSHIIALRRNIQHAIMRVGEREASHESFQIHKILLSKKDSNSYDLYWRYHEVNESFRESINILVNSFSQIHKVMRTEMALSTLQTQSLLPTQRFSLFIASVFSSLYYESQRERMKTQNCDLWMALLRSTMPTMSLDISQKKSVFMMEFWFSMKILIHSYREGKQKSELEISFLPQIIQKWEIKAKMMLERKEEKEKESTNTDTAASSSSPASTVSTSISISSLFSSVHLAELIILSLENGISFHFITPLLTLISDSLRHRIHSSDYTVESFRTFRLLCIAHAMEKTSRGKTNGGSGAIASGVNLFSVLSTQFSTLRTHYPHMIDGPLLMDYLMAAIANQSPKEYLLSHIINPLIQWINRQGDEGGNVSVSVSSISISSVSMSSWSRERKAQLVIRMMRMAILRVVRDIEMEMERDGRIEMERQSDVPSHGSLNEIKTLFLSTAFRPSLFESYWEKNNFVPLTSSSVSSSSSTSSPFPSPPLPLLPLSPLCSEEEFESFRRHLLYHQVSHPSEEMRQRAEKIINQRERGNNSQSRKTNSIGEKESKLEYFVDIADELYALIKQNQ